MRFLRECDSKELRTQVLLIGDRRVVYRSGDVAFADTDPSSVLRRTEDDLTRGPMKNMASCDMPRVGAGSLGSADLRMGKPDPGDSSPWSHPSGCGNPPKGNILVGGGGEIITRFPD
jgi:hypothetical protein